MPEGDSYTRAADRIRPILQGRALSAVDGVPPIRRAAARLIGATVQEIRTKGKHLLIDVDTGLTVHVWLGMPGHVEIAVDDDVKVVEMDRRSRRSPRNPGAVRLRLSTDHGTVRVVSAPTVEVERRRVIDAALARLGPDVLADEFDWDAFSDRSSRAPGDMLVADFLLDQRVLAGIGNEYKNEILFLEGLHPTTPMGLIDQEEREALARRARRLMLPNAHRSERVTTGVRGRSTESWVFERTGRPCRRCGSAIMAEAIGSRHARITYWCPRCQPSPELPRSSS